MRGRVARRRGRHSGRRGGFGRRTLLRSGWRGGCGALLVRFVVGADDIEHIAAVVAEGADIDLGQEVEAHERAVVAQFGFDAADRTRQRGSDIGKIELDRRVESQRQPLLGAIGGHHGIGWHGEDVAGESRLRRGMHAHRLGGRPLLRNGLALFALETIRLASAARQVGNDLGRQAGRLPAP